jgi:hypothetical protein
MTAEKGRTDEGLRGITLGTLALCGATGRNLLGLDASLASIGTAGSTGVPAQTEDRNVRHLAERTQHRAPSL